MKKLTIGILAHVDAGKTTLSEALLYTSGNIRKLGRVDKRDAFLDTYSLERERGITIFSKQAVLNTADTSITLIDTPGHADFSPEAERTLQILDGAILVISASDGVQSHAETIWKLLTKHQIPTFIFVNKTDLPNAGDGVLEADLRRKLSDSCMSAENLTDGEELSMCSEQLMEKYLSGEALTDDDISSAVMSRKLFPIFFGSALKTTGVTELLLSIEKYIREPKRPDTFGARVFKVTHTDKGERLVHMKITGGKLTAKEKINKDGWEEKCEQIRIYSGNKYDSVSEVTAGTVCAVTGLTKLMCGDTLGFEDEGDSPLLEPVLSYKVILPDSKDPFTVISQFRTLEEEEPTLKINFDERKKEIHVLVMGEIHLEVLKYQIKERFGLDVDFGHGNIVYRETISDTVEGVGHYEPLRHYSEVHLILEPAERGSGLAFESDCSENDFARNWQRLVLTHLHEKTHKGVLAGFPITDMKITLVAGKAHKKHTVGGDFREATYRAVRQGLMQAESVLLEPYYSFEIRVPEENIGRVMSDIQRMGGSFTSPELEDGISILKGSAPVSETRSYSLELASFTHGKGSITLSLKGYEPCHNTEEVLSQIGYDAEADVYNSPDSVFCEGGAGFSVKWYDVPSYMHIESVLASAQTPDSEERTVSERAKDYMKRVATDKELMEIFERTYGKIKPRESGEVIYNPSVKSVMKERPTVKLRPAPVFDGKEYLLVDGYNIIFAWDELKKDARESLDFARNNLIHRLCNYQGYAGIEIILVFDAYKVKKNPGSVEKHRNISVVYTKEAETADTYIERVSNELSKKHRVRVATSDGAEQMIILGGGALRVPAAAFHKELKDAESAISEIIS